MFKYVVLVALLALVKADKHTGGAPYLPTTGHVKETEKLQAVTKIVGTNVSGNITFTKTDAGILITGRIIGLTEGKHGFHVHSLGDITNGCASTGSHFNPHNLTHGGPNDTVRHVGDLGNIVANSEGVADVNFVDNVIALEGEHNILGRSIVVHEKEDDLGKGNNSDSLLTGNAGGRVGCGVIGTLSETSSASKKFFSSLLLMSMVFLPVRLMF